MERRLGPERYAAGTPWEGKILRLSEDIRRCVVFLGWQEAGPVDTAPIDPKGTGFLVSGGKTFPGRAFLVTARHVAEELIPPFVIRLNKKGGGAQLVHIERPQDIEWHFHGDKTVDLAVAPVIVPGWAYVRGINAEGMLEDAKDLSTVDAGDVVCVVGLFFLLSGKRENLPITHVGHVAMLPGDEKIPVDGTLQEGFLVQANAISGCSGSPVFSARQAKLTVSKHSIIGLHAGPATMLGVWTSSWKVDGSNIVTVGSADGSGQLAPLGMGVVTPLQKLVDILWSDDVKKSSDRLVKKVREQGSATADSLSKKSRPQPSPDNPDHREDFNRLLGAAVKRPKSSD